jgi:hypothetical protein
MEASTDQSSTRRVTQLADGLVQCRSCGMTEDYEHANDHWWWITTNGMNGEWECPDCEDDDENGARW